ncbi:Pre-mRNA-splicing factor sap61 [Coemansia sp. RSA 2336]|nr:Pre-mRNA-splicing factor sap61 [Coemansia sp. RSA 2336]
MDSIVEQQRQAHEDVERMEQAIVDLMLQNLTKHRYRLIREQKINELLEQIQQRSQVLLDLEKAEGLGSKEAARMEERGFDEFYDRLNDIRSYHYRNPDLVVRPPEMEFAKYKHNPEEADEKRKRNISLEETTEEAQIDEDILETFVDEDDEHKLETMFSGEERLGRYVDLNEQHDMYLNLKDARKLTYLEYLNEFATDSALSSKRKDKQYEQYLDSLTQYFEGYFARAMPLFNLPNTQREAQEAFDKSYKPESDSSDPLFCSVCQRQFEKQTTLAAHMNSRKHQKAAQKLQTASTAASQRMEHDRQLAWRKYLVQTYAKILEDRIKDTRANVERRQALTDEERQRELQDEEVSIDGDADDTGEQTYNPLNLPLGWDGKPIPFWLYKLHGLGVKFTCEICGNSVYRGRKAYEKHFQESRHATNMRRLGLPNTKQFHGISSIEEALTLWQRVEQEAKQNEVNVDTFEEYEDSEGNVFNKKTFMDLKRQGLI